MVVLRHLLATTPGAIAAILALPIGTMHSRLGRATAELRQIMGRTMRDLDRLVGESLAGLPGLDTATRKRARRLAIEGPSGTPAPAAGVSPRSAARTRSGSSRALHALRC